MDSFSIVKILIISELSKHLDNYFSHKSFRIKDLTFDIKQKWHRLSQASAHKSNENTKEVFSVTKVLKETQLQKIFEQLFIANKAVIPRIECIR